NERQVRRGKPHAEKKRPVLVFQGFNPGYRNISNHAIKQILLGGIRAVIWKELPIYLRPARFQRCRIAATYLPERVQPVVVTPYGRPRPLVVLVTVAYMEYLTHILGDVTIVFKQLGQGHHIRHSGSKKSTQIINLHGVGAQAG